MCPSSTSFVGSLTLAARFHCLYCRRFEEAPTANAAFLINKGDQPDEIDATVSYGQLAHQFTQDICILFNGHEHLLQDNRIKAALDHGVKANTKPIKRIERLGSGASTKVVFEDGSEETFGFLFHKPPTVLAGGFHKTLGLRLTAYGDIEVDRAFQNTSRPGVFACGDCTTPFKQVAIAMADGIRAGFGANKEILEEDYHRSWW